MNDYIAAILFFLPAGVANIMPVVANLIPGLRDWNTPLDFGKSYHGERLFGDNKRLRGLVVGILGGGLTALVISKLNVNTVATVAPFWAGCLLGAGAIVGDAVESFFKRQRGMKPGTLWFPFDQIDYIIGGLVFIYAFVRVPLWAIVTILLVYFGLHIVVKYLAFKAGLRKEPI